MVTGGTGAIGKAIALELARRPGHEVVITTREDARGRTAVDEIRGAVPGAQVRHLVIDLSSKQKTAELVADWTGPLHVLVNNAAIAPPERQESPEGVELQLATNVLSYLWLAEGFAGALESARPARVINVASYWAGDLDLGDLEFRRRPYDNDQAYRQSKQANRMLSTAIARKLAPRGISVNACHPGDVRSRLSRDLGFGGHQSPSEAARTPVWLATDPVGERHKGKYFEHQQETRCAFSEETETVDRLYWICSSY